LKRSRLKPGIYRLRCIKAHLKHAKASGDPYINIEAVLPEHDGYKLWDTIMLAGQGRTIGRQKIAGWGLGTITEPSPDLFVGRECSAHLHYEEWQGEHWLKVDIRGNKTGGFVLDEVWEGDVPPEPPKSPPEIKGGRPRVKPDPEEEDELPF
jgi:hypothetical protein